MRLKVHSEDMSEMGQASSRSVLWMVGGRLVRELCRRQLMASGAILKRSCCCEGRDPHGEEVHIPQL